MQPARLRAAIDRGLAFIASAQYADGNFASFSSPTKLPFTPALTYQTTFVPALILSAIAEHRSSATDKLAQWLLTQKSPHWSFNYWAASAPQRKTLPYPDDLDDTFCALIALHRYDASIISAEALANIVKVLIAAESRTGGPYRTWLAPKDAPSIWHDVDLAINANVAAFLKLVADPLPNLTKLMGQAIKSRTFHSPYYPSAYPVIYYIARAYDGPLAAELAHYIINRRRHGWWGSPLSTALAVTSLVRLGRADACDEALERLIDTQQPDGSWPAEAFCIDPAINNKTHYSGAPALTTAFAVEALSACRRPSRRQRTSPPERQDEYADELHKQIVSRIRDDLQPVPPVLRAQTWNALRRTLVNDTDQEIALLAHFFNQSLKKPLPAPSELFVRLGAANLYGWTAYTIYDDFLDNEGDPQALSAANAALRYSVEHFRLALPDNAAFQKFTADVFDVVDNANAWELKYCRARVDGDTITLDALPPYTRTIDLSNRSLGHTLTPLAVLAASGMRLNDRRIRHISLALRHYIAARQLNDDMHDWQQDLCTGIITYVVSRLLHETGVKPGTHRLGQLMPGMQRQFWNVTLPSICQIITRHTALARMNARASRLLAPDNLILKLADRIDRVVQKTLEEQAKAKDFLAAYAGPISLASPADTLPQP